MNKQGLIEQLPNFEQNLKLREISKNSIYIYLKAVNKFIKFLKHENEITKFDVIDFKEFLLNTDYEINTINNYLVSVGVFLSFLDLNDFKVEQVQAQHKNSLEDVLNAKEIKRLLRHAKEDDLEMYYLIKTFINTGIRLSERHFFTVENIKDSFYIKVRNKGKTRTVPIPQKLKRELNAYTKKRKIKTGCIFTLNDKQIWLKFKKYATQAKIKKKKAHAHSCRHYFAKVFLENNNNIAELADILGHSNLETTRIYARTTDLEKRRKIESIKF